MTFPATVMPPWGAQGRLHARGARPPRRLSADAARAGGGREGSRSQSLHTRTSRSASATTSTRRTILPCSAPSAPRRCGARRARRASRAPTATPAAPTRAMRGVATRYPKHVAAHGRVMALEDFLEVHGPETTGRPLPVESAPNVDLTMLDQDGLERAAGGGRHGEPAGAGGAGPGPRRLFEKRVGERNHSCADCHTPDRGGQQVPGRPPARRRDRRASPATSRPGGPVRTTRGTCAGGFSGA